MNMAVGIVCLWVGIALFYVAFHPLAIEGGVSGPGAVFKTLQTKIDGLNSAYDTTGIPSTPATNAGQP